MATPSAVSPGAVIAALLPAPPEGVEVLIDHGYRGVARVLADGGAFIAKWDTREGYTAREVEALHRAGHAGVPVADVLDERAEPVPCALLRWVEGVPLRGRAAPAAWRDAGRVLRLVHETEPVRQPEAPWAALMQHWFERSLDYLVEQRGLDAGDAATARRAAARLWPVIDAQPLVALHGDCQSDHFLLDPGTERVAGVLDWADSQAGDAVFDLAVLSLVDGDVLPDLLEGYAASADLREYVARTLPLYRAIRCAEGARWLDEHGYAGFEWPVDEVRRFARGLSVAAERAPRPRRRSSAQRGPGPAPSP